MGFRFRKSTSLFPGIRLNISKRGLSSLSIGKKGAMVNVNQDGVRTTVGLPGSGASYSDYTSYGDVKSDKPGARGKLLGWLALIAVILMAVAVFSG